MPILHKLYQTTEEKGILPNSFLRPTFALSKLDKDITRKQQTNISHEHRYKILNKILTYQIQQYMKRCYIMTKWDLSQDCKIGLIFENQCNLSKLIKKKKNPYNHCNRWRKSI